MTISDLETAFLEQQLSASPVHHYRCMASRSSSNHSFSNHGDFRSRPLALVTGASFVALLIASTGAMSPTASMGNPQSGNPQNKEQSNELSSANLSPLGEAIALSFQNDWIQPARIAPGTPLGPLSGSQLVAPLSEIDPEIARRFLSSNLHRLDKFEPRSRSDQRLILEGLKLYTKGDYLQAGLKFKRAKRDNPENATARLGLALAFSKLGYHDRAFDELLAALRINRRDPVTLYYGSRVLQTSGRTNRAKELAQRALISAPEVREWLKEDLTQHLAVQTY